MKICWFGIYDEKYSRNNVLINGLTSSGETVLQCNTYGQKGLKKYFQLIKKIRSLHGNYDVLYCAFPNNYNVLLAKIFQRKPIVIDAFFPLYDAYIVDRKAFSRYSLKAFMYYWLDKINIFLADVVIVDTGEHKKYWRSISEEKSIEIVPVGADTSDFFPERSTNSQNDTVLVTFHGSYIPLQGIDKIIAAAALLRESSTIKFRFIGKGQQYEEMVKKINDEHLDIELLPWLSIQELNTKLNESDIVLGIFGDTDKTDRVVPNKLFQGVAVKKPVITKDTPAVRELFTDEEIYMVSNAPEDIARAIVYLSESKLHREQFADNAYTKFKKQFSEVPLGARLGAILSTKV